MSEVRNILIEAKLETLEMVKLEIDKLIEVYKGMLDEDIQS